MEIVEHMNIKNIIIGEKIMHILGIAWENILVGLLSGLFVFSFSYVSKRF